MRTPHRLEIKSLTLHVDWAKSVQVTFTTRRKTTSNLEQCEDPSSQGREIFGTTSRSQTGESTYSPSENNLEFNWSKMYWLLGSKSQLSIESKLLLYKAILESIWTYGVQLWGTAAN